MPTNKTADIAPSHVEVAAALIIHDGQILITQRPAHKIFGGYWEFPGGKQQPGESLAECLRRELAEELNITVEVGSELFRVEHCEEHLRITLHMFLCAQGFGAPERREVQDWQWVSVADLARYPLTPADQKVVQRIIARDAPNAILKLLCLRRSSIP